MPLPTKNKGESEQDFVNRCAGSKVMNKEFPDQKQKLAVCYYQARKTTKEDVVIPPKEPDTKTPTEFEQKVDEIFDK